MIDREQQAPFERDELSALARLAGLELPEDRVDGVIRALSAVEREHAALRALPPDLESHLVFDPRWD